MQCPLALLRQQKEANCLLPEMCWVQANCPRKLKTRIRWCWVQATCPRKLKTRASRAWGLVEFQTWGSSGFHDVTLSNEPELPTEPTIFTNAAMHWPARTRWLRAVLKSDTYKHVEFKAGNPADVNKIQFETSSEVPTWTMARFIKELRDNPTLYTFDMMDSSLHADMLLPEVCVEQCFNC